MILLCAKCNQPKVVLFFGGGGGGVLLIKKISENNFTISTLEAKQTVIKFFALKGIFQPFELGGVARLILSAVKFCKAGH